jgi:site-specific recombinase XerD
MDNHMTLSNNAWATRQNYLRGIRDLMLHLSKRPEDCSVDELKAYLVHVRDKQQLSSSSVNLRICGLKYYCREVVNRLDLVVKIPNHRHQKYFTEILTTQEVLRLFGACRDIRQKLVLQLIYETGLRVREITRLRVSDFDKQLRTITVYNSKGRKTRSVPYGEQLRLTLAQYCKVRGGVPANTLIESIKEPGNPLSRRGVQHIVREAVRRSGIKKRIHPHTLRHTFAVHYLNFGGSLPDLQRLLGHEHITTTLHYLKYAHLSEHPSVSVLDCLIQTK